MTVRFHDSAHPYFQTTDTFQQLIQDLNHFGDIHDSDMKYLDSAIGPGGTLSLNGLGDFTANTIVDALNELDSDLHGVGGGNFKADTNTAYKTVTDAINEIERVFDASSGEILYPTGDVTETQTRLLISTAQSGGQRIELRAGHNIFLDAVNDVIIDAGGANITFKDDSAIRFDFQMGANQEIDVPTGNLTIDVAGDITLDADGNDIKFKNGAGGDEVTHTLADNASYTITAPDDVTIDAVGSIFLDAATGESVKMQSNGSDALTFSIGGTQSITAVSNLSVYSTGAVLFDATGDITLDADGGDVFLKDAGTQFAALTNTSGNLILKSGTTTAMTFSGANVTVAGSITMPPSGTGSPITTTKTVDGALSDINSRIPNVYDRNGTLLNPLP